MPDERHDYENIFFPGVYHGRDDKVYTQRAVDMPFELLVKLVRERAEEDGEWTIEHNLVGNNPDKMRRMMAFVANPKHIDQARNAILNGASPPDSTVDFLCRDLANASAWGIAARDQQSRRR